MLQTLNDRRWGGFYTYTSLIQSVVPRPSVGLWIVSEWPPENNKNQLHHWAYLWSWLFPIVTLFDEGSSGLIYILVQTLCQVTNQCYGYKHTHKLLISWYSQKSSFKASKIILNVFCMYPLLKCTPLTKAFKRVCTLSCSFASSSCDPMN